MLAGQVFDADCTTPLANTRLDIWQADPTGGYSEGFNLGSDDFVRALGPDLVVLMGLIMIADRAAVGCCILTRMGLIPSRPSSLEG